MPDPSTVDFGRRSDDYATHRPGFPDSFYARLERYLSFDGAEALDLGTGPGIVALELAKCGAEVVGVDRSQEQIATAQRRAADAGLDSRARFVVGLAEETGFADESFDLVTAGQCWVWFDHDRALAEVQRMLRPGGHLVVAHYCYLPRVSAIARRSEELVGEHNPSWTMAGWDGVYATQIDAMQQGHLCFVEQFCYDHDRPFTHEGWRGRMRTCNGVGSGTLTEEQVAAFDADLAAMLRREFPQEPLKIEHRVWAVVCRKPVEKHS